MKSRVTLIAAYLSSIVAANWAIAHVGTQYDPHGPHVLSVGFGLSAPSGVYVVGLTLVLRDLVQRQIGKPATFGLIFVGAALSAFISPALAVASGVAFLVSETVDFAVFSLTERFGLLRAVVLSNAVALVVDSWIFLTLAFGSLAFIEGQIVGKAWATLAGALAIRVLRGGPHRVIASGPAAQRLTLDGEPAGRVLPVACAQCSWTHVGVITTSEAEVLGRMTSLHERGR